MRKLIISLAALAVMTARVAAGLQASSQASTDGLVERRGYPCCSQRCCRLHGRPSRDSTGTAGGPIATSCSGV